MDKRAAVLVSGSGSNLQALIDDPRLRPVLHLVAADRPDAGGLERAREAGIEAVAVEPSAYADRTAWDTALADRVAEADPDVVVLAGFMRILSPDFVRRWAILNVHPSLLPAFPGPRAVEDALAWGVKVTGCTVHFVDEQVDHGPIVAQEAVPVQAGDTVESLHDRIKAVEHRLLPDCVARFCADRLRVRGRYVEVLEP